MKPILTIAILISSILVGGNSMAAESYDKIFTEGTNIFDKETLLQIGTIHTIETTNKTSDYKVSGYSVVRPPVPLSSLGFMGERALRFPKYGVFQVYHLELVSIENQSTLKLNCVRELTSSLGYLTPKVGGFWGLECENGQSFH